VHSTADMHDSPTPDRDRHSTTINHTRQTRAHAPPPAKAIAHTPRSPADQHADICTANSDGPITHAKTTSRTSPDSPALRANPFPKVTDPFCRLPLPTCEPWRPAADIGTIWHENYNLPSIFKERPNCSGHCKKCNAFRAPSPYL